MLQGINLIQDGLQFLEWMNDYKDINTIDALSILRDELRKIVRDEYNASNKST